VIFLTSIAFLLAYTRPVPFKQEKFIAVKQAVTATF